MHKTKEWGDFQPHILGGKMSVFILALSVMS